MQAPFRFVLRLLGKGEAKVSAVFGFTAAGCHQAVAHLRSGAPQVPIWLFSTEPPDAATLTLCERSYVNRSALALLLMAESRLWPRWVAISVTTWTGGHGRWPLKLAPFLIPPFRVLLLNENGDFFPGSPAEVARHAARRLRDFFHSGWHSAKDIAQGCWRLISYHVWRSGPVTRVKDEAAGVILLAASIGLRIVSAILGWCGLPPYRLFDRLHGNEALDVETSRKIQTDREVARFVAPSRRWDGRKFEEFLRGSEAEWILWNEEEAHEDSAWAAALEDARKRLDMSVVLARRETADMSVCATPTFAISRQTHFRAWKAMLFPLAPFRTLQAEEVSQVMAPLSSTILVNRRKLLALGIPRCSLSGTAWMLLFWKATATGWRSYSVGQERALQEQPDLPMQETGFLFGLFRDSALRRLGPRDADLARGSIAFAAARPPLPRAGTNRLRVLVVSPFLPYPLSHGGAVRIYNLCRALADRVDFVLAAVREAHDVTSYDKLHEVFRGVYVVDKDERASGSDEWPAQVREHQSQSLRALVAELARKWQPDVLQVEYTHMAEIRAAAAQVPALLVEHDLTFSLYRQLAEAKGAGAAERREYERWRKFESGWLAAYDGVWTVSEEDRDTAIQAGGRKAGTTFAIPNGVDIARFVPGDQSTPSPEIFYVGSFRHLPNILGFEKLREEVMPRVWRRFPEVRLRVVAGPQHELFWKRFSRTDAPPDGHPKIEIHGFVEDLRPLYAKAAVVVVPLEVSAGTNIKVLEAMACGKAVVTTPIGCAGLGLRDRVDALIDAEWTAFAESVCSLLSDVDLRARVATQARRTAEDRFSWTAIANEAYESYLALAESRRARLVERWPSGVET